MTDIETVIWGTVFGNHLCDGETNVIAACKADNAISEFRKSQHPLSTANLDCANGKHNEGRALVLYDHDHEKMFNVVRCNKCHCLFMT